ALLKARTPQGAIAWTISLLALPLLTVPMYLVFGRNRFDGYLEQRSELEARSNALIEGRAGVIRDHIVEPDTPLYASLCALARMPPTRGNTVELLIDGEQTFDSLAAGLQRAEKYVLFQFYIIRDDALGRRIGKLLSDRARAGVRVCLLYDEFGSYTFPGTRLHKQLLQTGVEVVPFNTTQGRRNRLQLNFRNHRKVVVVDGREAWIGGLNIGDEYLHGDRRLGYWRDTHARFEGPAVHGAELAFATDWLWATRKILDIDWDFSTTSEGDCEVLVFPSDPASDYEEAGLMYHQLIASARERIWIASPYFVPDRAIISALQLAALRGVDVRVMIPEKAEGHVLAMANWSYTRELMPVGVKVYRFQGGYMHQKVVLMDNATAGVGTANFDNRSFRLNFEITLLVESTEFARDVEQMLEADFQQCRQVTLRDLEDKPGWFPFAMGAARLFAPLL
ncbi:MAG: cardiolipin synthase, partial [Halioglobus sp.]|nr:cardiolipin synthase [Halioglobus sp.]